MQMALPASHDVNIDFRFFGIKQGQDSGNEQEKK